MNKKISRMIAILLVLVLCVSTTALAEDINYIEKSTLARASSYIDSSTATITSSKGTITVRFSIIGTAKMTSLGATKIEIKSSSGTTLKTYTTGLMGSDVSYHSGSITYAGVSGVSYYAVVYFKAANSSGSDTTTKTTASIKA